MFKLPERAVLSARLLRRNKGEVLFVNKSEPLHSKHVTRTSFYHPPPFCPFRFIHFSHSGRKRTLNPRFFLLISAQTVRFVQLSLLSNLHKIPSLCNSLRYLLPLPRSKFLSFFITKAPISNAGHSILTFHILILPSRTSTSIHTSSIQLIHTPRQGFQTFLMKFLPYYLFVFPKFAIFASSFRKLEAPGVILRLSLSIMYIIMQTLLPHWKHRKCVKHQRL